MNRTRFSCLVIFVLLQVFQNVSCAGMISSTGKDSHNDSNIKEDKKANLEMEHFSDKIYKNPSDEKIIEKRQLFYQNDDYISPTTTERQLENTDYHGRRRTNFSKIESEIETSEAQQEQSNWENERNRFSFSTGPGNFQNFAESRTRQPFAGQRNLNERYDWDRRSNNFEQAQPQWNGQNDFQHYNHQFNSRVNNNFGSHAGTLTNDSDMKAVSKGTTGDVFNTRTSITTLSDADAKDVKNFNKEMVAGMNPGYLGHSNMNYYHKNHNGFWNADFYKPEKGLIINFNTDCPTPRQFNNQLVHKFIFAPKGPMSTIPEISTFQIPRSAVISAPKMTPMYYL